MHRKNAKETLAFLEALGDIQSRQMMGEVAEQLMQTKQPSMILKLASNTGAECINDMMDDPMPVVQASDLVEAGWSQKQAEVAHLVSLVASGQSFMMKVVMPLILYQGEEEEFDNLREFFVEEVAS